jgi:cytochrome c peroxidase
MTRGLLVSLAIAALTAACSSSGEATATCADDLSAAECDKLQSIVLPATLPPAAGNEYSVDFNSALFGFHVFFDSRFSKNQDVRCESCHSVDTGFADNQPVPVAGLGPGSRNSPTIFNAARYTTFFWDGRADSLWSQPLFALENPNEMGFTRLEIVHQLNTLYTAEYGNAFGTLADFSDLTRFPAQGAPGDAAFDAMSAEDKATVNGTVANVGKALEAYMRKLAAGPSLIDQYLSSKAAGASGAAVTLSAAQERGMVVFAKSGCLDCHSGPQLSDNQFHNLGLPAAAGKDPDPGHSEAALTTLDKNPFNAAGPFFVGSPAASPEGGVLGGFRTPSLRNLPKSAPFGHNGTFPTLEGIVDFHLQGGGMEQQGYVGTVDPQLISRDVSTDDRAALVEFLKALSGSYPALPWGEWPGGNG